ncbi:MAG: hypothetical protein JWQ96_1668 [Segetibacter sp.]|nr:hypothetical protein [Segetibacter sp.]
MFFEGLIIAKCYLQQQLMIDRTRLSLKKKIIIGVILLLIVLIKSASLFPLWIENYYSTAFYPLIAIFYRFLWGWLPFSVGDILYAVAGGWLIIKSVKVVRKLIKRQVTAGSFKRVSYKSFIVASFVYIYFNLSWGLNYNRLGIEHQLQLKSSEHTLQDLQQITGLLITKLNTERKSLGENIRYPKYQDIFKGAIAAYSNAKNKLAFFKYDQESIKRSYYGRMGSYVGFLGYYNPFTGESQLNLTQPRFLVPYVTCHEVAHQLGYADESEASFVGYLAATNSTEPLFHYSAYFDLFNYANRELFILDSSAARNNIRQLDTMVRKDISELRAYLAKSRNPVEPVIKVFYDQYLKANQQTSGLKSYNEVVGLLVAYYKKFGRI